MQLPGIGKARKQACRPEEIQGIFFKVKILSDGFF
jgi:hypothetical protein